MNSICHVFPTEHQLARARNIDGELLQVLTMVRLRRSVDGVEASAVTSAEAYEAYRHELDPVFRRVGGRRFSFGEFEMTLIGPDEEQWDLMFIDEYPDTGALRRVMEDPARMRAERRLGAAVEDSRVFCIRAAQSW